MIRAKTIRLSGNKFTIRAKILLAKFSLLNIEIMLKGTPIKELKNASNVKIRRIDSTLLLDVLDDIYKDVGKTIIVARAVKNENFVNTFRFFLSKKSPLFK
ncbi:sodium:proton antiporter [Neobacillus drentensis]|uniref:sodium:proton antiporter n=1 Tax=Neobacillus drentensis TaxID=220684 RepID=UPI003000F7B4